MIFPSGLDSDGIGGTKRAGPGFPISPIQIIPEERCSVHSFFVLVPVMLA